MTRKGQGLGVLQLWEVKFKIKNSKLDDGVDKRGVGRKKKKSSAPKTSAALRPGISSGSVPPEEGTIHTRIFYTDDSRLICYDPSSPSLREAKEGLLLST